MTNKTKAAIDKVEKGSLIRDMIIGVATALIGVGAGRVTVKEAKTEVAVSSLKNDVAGITAEVSTIKNDVAGITAEVSTIKTDVAGIKNDTKSILEAINAMSTGTPGTPTPKTKPAPAPTTPTVTKAPMPPKVSKN